MTVGELKKALDHISPETTIKIKIKNGDDERLYFVKDLKDVAVRFTLPEGKPELHLEVSR